MPSLPDQPKASDDYKKLSGVQKTAIFLLAVGEEHSGKMFAQMEDEEIKEVSHAMSNLGRVNAEIVEQLFMDFS
ncbi:MAG: flagellar motor switch protein FliG, partial [Alphaproteobacteria bacterium]|nr:flagellar motor switch protein FliG [Alphaproteobacteria bacterium]